ncbi:transposase [Kangiella sp. M94]
MFQERNRRSIRLSNYDYSSPGAYFVTICTQDHQCLFGNITNNGDMELNAAGAMVKQWYKELEHKFVSSTLDYFICMPNHVHFTVFLGQTRRSAPTNLNSIVQWFKTMTTNDYIRGVKENGWPTFNKRLWQRNYWERVIRSETELQKFRGYIKTNPTRWHLDKLNPENF